MTQLLSVATGLISVYIILALIVSHVGEWFSSIVNQRGKLLERAIIALLAGRAAAANAGTPPPAAGPAAAADKRDPAALVSQLYQHPLIGNLGADGRLPSYIPSRTFTLSLVAAITSFTASNPPPVAANPFTKGAADWNALRTAVANLPAGTLRSSLETLLDEGQADYTSALGAIDTWFDLQMDRIAGTYKRWSTKIQIVIALVVVGVLNADTIAIANQLLHSSALAPALTNAAQSAQGTNLDIQALLGKFSAADLSIGWSAPPFGSIPLFLAKLGGLVITTFAALLGAPFWFDILKQIVPVRMSGAKPVKNKAGAKGDKQATVMPQPRSAP